MNVRLLPLDETMLAKLKEAPAAALAGVCLVRESAADWLKMVADQSLQFYSRTGAPPPWIGYLVIDTHAGQAAGTCGFKGGPNAAGEVEIAYGTLPEYEGRGVASAAAAALADIARQRPEATRIIAHTLPESNASCRVLEKAGFQCVGEVSDPEDGQVWRWELAGRQTS